MIIHHVLEYLFNAPSVLSILRELELREKGLTGREIARLAKLTPQAAHNTLTNLESLKVIRRELAGKSHFFYLNRRNYLYKNIVNPMLKAERQYKEHIFKEITNCLGMDSVSLILFGSVARNESTVESDLDICIVYTNHKGTIEKKVSILRETILDKYGVTLGPFYIKKNEFKFRAKKNEPPVNEILKEGKVLYGLSLEALNNG